jgi:hypothetical protein
VGIPEWKRIFGYTGTDGRVLLECIIEIQGGSCALELSDLVAGYCEHGNKPSNTTKGGELFDQPNDIQFFKVCAP